LKIDATTNLSFLIDLLRLTTTFWMTNRWLLLNFDALGASVLVTTLFSIATLINGAGLAGFMRYGIYKFW